MIFGSILQWLTGGLALAALGAMLARVGWPFELFSHFRAQYAAGAITVAALSAATGDWITGVAGLSVALWAMFGIITHRPAPMDATLHANPGLTVAWANVWKKPGALERTVAWAADRAADVILLGEFPSQRDVADGFPGDYPHRAGHGRQ